MAPTGVFCHHHSQQTDFRCKSPFIWQQRPKMPVFRPKKNTKNYTYLSSIFNPNMCSKMNSLHLQQTSRSTLGIWLEVFLSRFSAGYTSATLSDPVLRISSCPKGVLGNSAVAQTHSFHHQYYQQKIQSIEFYYSKLAQIALVGPGIRPQNGRRE